MAAKKEMAPEAVEEAVVESGKPTITPQARAELAFMMRRSPSVIIKPDDKLVARYDELTGVGLLEKSVQEDNRLHYQLNEDAATSFLKETRKGRGGTPVAQDADPSKAEFSQKAKWLPTYLEKGYEDAGIRTADRAEASAAAAEIRKQKRLAVVAPLTHKCWGVLATPEGMVITRGGGGGLRTPSLLKRIDSVLESPHVSDDVKEEIQDTLRKLKDLTATAENSIPAEAEDQDE